MAERRQAHRREPIEVEVRERVFEAHPLPWLKRNDLGNEILRQYTVIVNSMMKAYVDEDNTPQLEMYLNDKLSDPVAVVAIAYPADEETIKFINELDYSELLELIFAAMEVNQLESIRHLVDPNSPAPTTNGGTSSAGTQPDQAIVIPSPPSSPDSALLDSIEKQSSTSPTGSSSTSLENKSESSGTSDGGSSL